jgi:hypothetical protein
MTEQGRFSSKVWTNQYILESNLSEFYCISNVCNNFGFKYIHSYVEGVRILHDIYFVYRAQDHKTKAGDQTQISN